MNIKNTGPMDFYGQVRLEKPDARIGGRPSQTRGAVSPQTDTVAVSDEALLRTEAYRTAMNASDIRSNKVNAIKDQLATGAYQINTHRIAANMVHQESEML